MYEDYMFEEEEKKQKQQQEPVFNQVSQSNQSTAMAVVSFVLGSASMVLFLSGFAMIGAIIAIILGIIYIATTKGKAGKSFAIAGIVTGILCIGLFIGSWVLIVSNVDNTYDAMKEMYEMATGQNIDATLDDLAPSETF